MKLGREINNVSSIRLGRVMITPAQLYIFVALFLFVAWGSAKADDCYLAGTSYPAYCNSGYDIDAYCGNNSACQGDRYCIHSCVDNGVYKCEQYTCKDNCSRDSAVCVQSGDTWMPSSTPGECGECRNECPEEPCVDGSVWDPDSCACVSDPCASYRVECHRAKGTFSGSGNSGCCIATCNQCGELTKLINFKTKVCCDQGLAPPDTARRCTFDARNTCGMNWSYVTSNDNEYQCQSPSLDSAASQRYASQCFGGDGDNGGGDGSSNSNGSSSSGGSSSSDEASSSSSDEASSSSSDDGSSSSMDDEGETDCPECDKLDSVIDTLSAIHGSIEDIYFCLITPNECPGITYEDTLNFQFDTAWTFYIRPFLDTTLALDSAKLSAILRLDTHYVNQLKLDTLLLKNDTLTRTALKDFAQTNDTNLMRLREGVFSMDTAMKHHIDSLIRRIPDSVLDSIVKYQDSTLDRIDTALFGKGKGFSLIDSLIDTTVKYFQRSNHYDSVYSLMFGDSISMLGESVRWLPSGIGYAMGYGDTATSNLRGDLNGIREAIEGLGDGLGGDIAGALDSAWGNGTAAEGSGFEDYGTDSAGYAGVLDSYYSEGTTVDSAYLVDGDTCSTVDCIVSNVNYNVDSMGEAFKASLDTQYRSLSDSSSVWFDSIKKNLMFVDFDSVLVDPLRQRIPNTNTCPENCFSFDVASGVIPGVNKITYPLCKNFTIGGISTNGLLIVRLILRILTAMCCIYIGLWYIAGKKG